jgi:hypothetical protein
MTLVNAEKISKEGYSVLWIFHLNLRGPRGRFFSNEFANCTSETIKARSFLVAAKIFLLSLKSSSFDCFLSAVWKLFTLKPASRAPEMFWQQKTESICLQTTWLPTAARAPRYRVLAG